MRTKQNWVALAIVAAAIVGCAPPEEPVPSTPSTPIKEREVKLTSAAGVPQTVPAEPVSPTILASAKRFPSRNDPFALKPNERQFDRDQEVLRVFGETGFSVQYEQPEEKAPTQEDIPEPQPYRRLAGVVVGDSILALIDMGNGALEVIRPGQQIPNSEWRVISIDSEKAILRRNGNRTPRQITIRLESPPPGFGGNTGQVGGGMPGMPGGPGGSPGGFPGRPGMGGPGGRPGSGLPDDK